MKHILSTGQKLMAKDGTPSFLFIDQKTRNAAWVRNPPTAGVTWRDPNAEKWRELQERQKKEATAARIAKLVASKKKPAPFDMTGLRWCSRSNKWIPDEERTMKRLTISSYDKTGEKIVRGCTTIAENATETQIDLGMANAAKRGGVARVVRITVTDEQDQVKKTWSLETDGPLPIPAVVVKAKTEEAPVAKKASKAKVSKAKKAPRGNGKAKSNGGARSGSKTEIISNLLKRKSGCTSAEVLAATGWPAVSMPAMAKAAGLKLRKDKVQGKVTRYFGS